MYVMFVDVKNTSCPVPCSIHSCRSTSPNLHLRTAVQRQLRQQQHMMRIVLSHLIDGNAFHEHRPLRLPRTAPHLGAAVLRQLGEEVDRNIGPIEGCHGHQIGVLKCSQLVDHLMAALQNGLLDRLKCCYPHLHISHTIECHTIQRCRRSCWQKLSSYPIRRML